MSVIEKTYNTLFEDLITMKEISKSIMGNEELKRQIRKAYLQSVIFTEDKKDKRNKVKI